MLRFLIVNLNICDQLQDVLLFFLVFRSILIIMKSIMHITGSNFLSCLIVDDFEQFRDFLRLAPS